MKSPHSRHPLSIALSLASLSLAALLPAAAAQAQDDEQGLDCLSRDCLIQLADDYMAALVAHDPSRLPFADDVVFVENVDRKPLGEGLWQTASAPPSSFKIIVPDEVAREVGMLAVMEEQGEPVLITLRLKVVDGQIEEVEHLLARNLREASLANLERPREGLLSEIPEQERMERHELLGIAYSYYDALTLEDGTLTPFAEDCQRHENGMITVRPRPEKLPEQPNLTELGCTEQLNTGLFDYIKDIDNRRVPIVDPVTGLALGFSHFRHEMDFDSIPITGVPGMESREMNFDPFDLPAAHIYKIRNGLVHEIEAMGFTTEYMTPYGVEW